MAVLIGEFMGAFAACVGLAYLWVGLLWLARAKKRWPSFTYWSAAIFSLVLALITALMQATAAQSAVYVAAGLAAAGLVLWRGKKSQIAAHGPGAKPA